MFKAARSEISHTGHSQVRISISGPAEVMREIHIGDPQIVQVGRSIDLEFGVVVLDCVMALPFQRERGRVSQPPTPTDKALAGDV